MDETNYFRAALKFLIKERGGQSNLASDSHTSEGYISQLLAGKRNNPSQQKAKKIASAVGTTYFEMLILGKSILEKDSPNHITEQLMPYSVAERTSEDKYRVIAEVGEILDSGNVDIIDALVKNVREFRRAVDTTKKLTSCLDQIDAMQTQINKLTQKVDGLTAPPTGADVSAASSGKGET